MPTDKLVMRKHDTHRTSRGYNCQKQTSMLREEIIHSSEHTADMNSREKQADCTEQVVVTLNGCTVSIAGTAKRNINY